MNLQEKINTTPIQTEEIMAQLLETEVFNPGDLLEPKLRSLGSPHNWEVISAIIFLDYIKPVWGYELSDNTLDQAFNFDCRLVYLHEEGCSIVLGESMRFRRANS